MWQNGLIARPAPMRGIAHHAVRADRRRRRQRHVALEHAADVDRDVASAREAAAHVDARRVGQRDALLQQPRRRGCAGGCARARASCALLLTPRVSHTASGCADTDRHAVGDGARDDVGQVILALRIVVATASPASCCSRAVGATMMPVLISRDRALGSAIASFCSTMRDDRAARRARCGRSRSDRPARPVSIDKLSPPAVSNSRCSDSARVSGTSPYRTSVRHVVAQLRQRLHHRVAGAELGFLPGKCEVGSRHASWAPCRRRGHK